MILSSEKAGRVCGIDMIKRGEQLAAELMVENERVPTNIARVGASLQWSIEHCRAPNILRNCDKNGAYVGHAWVGPKELGVIARLSLHDNDIRSVISGF